MYSKRTYRIIAAIVYSGILLFVATYVIATFYYPGGSDYDRGSQGFDWLHNYWCELLAEKGKNRQLNEARPIAIGAFIVLDITMLLCWLQASFLLHAHKFLKGLLVVCGIASCISLVLLSSPSHDLVINISGAFGLTALALTLYGLFKQRLHGLFVLGLVCILLFFLNTYIYYTGTWFDTLAVVQKISFAAFLSWFWQVAGAMKNQTRSPLPPGW